MTSASSCSMEDYLLKFHGEEILRILKSPKTKKKSIQINLSILVEENEEFFGAFCIKYDAEHDKWKKALQNVTGKLLEHEGMTMSREDSYIDIEYFQHPETCWPRIEKGHLWKVVEFRGYVYRVTSATKMEYVRGISCKVCKKSSTLKGDRIFNYAFTCPRNCILTPYCKGSMAFNRVEERVPEYTLDFQEFKLQELAKATPKNRYLLVQAEGSLVNACTIGDTVRILGILEYRMNPHELTIKKFVLRALNIKKESLELKLILEPEEMSSLINAWNEDRKKHGNNEIKTRNEMLKAVAPELSGCFGLKLALLMTLCSGGGKAEKPNHMTQFETKDREVCHLLLAGVPGVGKSQLIKSAMKISARAIKTTGSATSKAGLTASYYREKGEYHIEAGALVLANNGICCIDEFNLMPVIVRQAMHETMEQQKFMICKAAVKIEIATKCSVIAVMNHKLKNIPKDARTESQNELKELNMEASLASRFDLIFRLEHPGGDYDLKLLDYILGNIMKTQDQLMRERTEAWDMKRLQLHVICAKGIEVEISDVVIEIMNTYFQYCQACEGINMSRITFRMKNSLQRLTVAHAKMLLRKKAMIIDIMTVIWLMENSWTFGNLIQPIDLVTSELPIGPSDDCVEYILQTLNLTHLIRIYHQEQRASLNESLSVVDSNKFYGAKDNDGSEYHKAIPLNLQKSFAINSIEDLFADDNEDPKEAELTFSTFPSFCASKPQTSTQHEEPETTAFKKPSTKRSTELPESDATLKKQRIVGADNIEDSLEMINDLMGIEEPVAPSFKKTSEKKPMTLFAALSSKKSNSKQPNKSSPASFASRLERFKYVSQELNEEEPSPGELSLNDNLKQWSKQVNEEEQENEYDSMDDIDPDNFDPYN